MPVIKSAKKKLKQDKKRTLHNNKIRAALDSVIKKTKKNPTVEAFRKASQAIDKAAKKHLIHKNKAAHIKSALSKLTVGKSTPKKPVTKKKSSQRTVTPKAK